MNAAFLAGGLLMWASAAAAAEAPRACAGPMQWPHWNRYVEAFVSSDGRVIDRSAGDRSTSEGQAYALFFSLVANDRPLFDRILRWSEDNLAQGDLARQLPAWKWGADSQGRWGVLDGNSASDADLWLAYTLLEAGRLWFEPRYGALARQIIANVASREVAELPALGPMLLPAPYGFELEGGRGWRLNPSYLAPQVLRRLVTARAPGPWRAVLANTVRMLDAAARHGAVPDWIVYSRRGFDVDPVRGAVGSYDAIRTYLWIGMLSPEDPAWSALSAATGGMLRVWVERGRLPEQLDVRSLRGRGDAPIGFYAALMPLARACAERRVAQRLEERLARAFRDGLFGERSTYYDQNLVLFAGGFVDGRYRFAVDGALAPEWEGPCVR